MYAPVRDGQLYFVIDGADEISDLKKRKKPMLVVLHGGPGGTHKSLRPVLSKLSPGLCVIHIDQRGSGQSFHASRETYTLQNNVRDLEEFRSFLGVDQFSLLGFSYGGMVAMSYAIQYPDNLKNLIVVNSAPSFHFIEKARNALSERGTSHQVAIAEKLWAGAFQSDADYAQFFEELRSMYSIRAARGETAISGTRHVSYEPVNEAFGGFLRRYDIRSQLNNITARTLVIAAEHDWMCPPEFSEDIAAGIEGSELRVVSGSGHHITEDQPDELLRLISGFVRQYNGLFGKPGINERHALF